MATADVLVVAFRIVAFRTPAGTSSLWGALGGLIAFLSLMLVWMRLVSWSMPVIPAPAALTAIPVDERQQAVRDRSFRRAYQAGFLMFLVSAVAAYIFQDDLPGLLRRISELKLLTVALSQIALLLATLPVIFLAWTEPDESEGKPVEEAGLEEQSAAGV
jgi:hypothetical protein